MISRASGPPLTLVIPACATTVTSHVATLPAVRRLAATGWSRSESAARTVQVNVVFEASNCAEELSDDL